MSNSTSEEQSDPNIIILEKFDRIFYKVDGFIISEFAYKKLDDLKNFEIRKDDVWVASYPKSGTTWLQEIVYLIENDCDFQKAVAKTLIERSPYLEHRSTDLNTIVNLESPRIIKTHLPINFLPENFQDKCKVIYVMRNPKDVLVSFYHFFYMLTKSGFTGELKDIINLFKKGTVPNGPWWGHVDGYANKNNIFLVKYEDLHKKPREIIKSLSQFLEKELNDNQIDAIIEWCSFEKMKNNPSVGLEVREMSGLFKKECNFYRKGKIGDWINHFTPEESIEFDKVVEENLKYAANFDYGVSDEELKHFLESISLNDNSNSSDSSDNASTPASSEYHASTDIPSSSASSSLEASPSQVESSSAADASSSVAHPVSSDAQEASSSNEQPSQPVTVTSSESSEPSEK